MRDGSDGVTGDGAERPAPEDGGTSPDRERTESGEERARAEQESADVDEEMDMEALREQVEAEYDFEDFGPAEMRDMSPAEWEAAFDDESWVTGEELLDRVEADLRSRVASRDVFAVVERLGDDRSRVVAYSDEGYAVVDADGTVDGRGTVLRDVKPTVALASMPEYEVPDPPEGTGLPAPEEVPEDSGGLGNAMLQFVAAAMGLCGLVLLGAPVVADLGGAGLIAVVAGLAFLGTALFLLLVVANARLSARFRAEEYRERLRAAGVTEGQRPEFLPVDDREFED